MKKKLAIVLMGLTLLSFSGCNTSSDASSAAPSSVEQSVEESSQETSQESEEASSEETTKEESSEASEASEESKAEEEDPLQGAVLQDLFAQHGMKTGTCLNPSMLKNTKFCNLITTQFNSVTCENAMKPDYLFNKKQSQEEGRLVVEFDKDALNMMQWAKDNGLSMRGHTLVWYSQTPDWIFHEDFDTKKGLVSRDVMLERMDSYIQQVFAKLDELGYTDIFYAYDIVNEAWMEDGTMRQNRYTEIIGDDYLWQAFNIANKYAPESIDLYYNDYNEQFKTQTLVDFVETLKDENGNYLIDGIGLQAHLYTSDDLEDYLACVETLGATGLKVQLTELDVCLGAYLNYLEATDDNLKEQGRYYYDLINGLFELKDSGKVNLDALTFWGFFDTMSWRKEASPLLFDQKFQPKYAFFGAAQMKELAGY